MLNKKLPDNSNLLEKSFFRDLIFQSNKWRNLPLELRFSTSIFSFKSQKSIKSPKSPAQLKEIQLAASARDILSLKIINLYKTATVSVPALLIQNQIDRDYKSNYRRKQKMCVSKSFKILWLTQKRKKSLHHILNYQEKP